jgi:hypothetical protein
MTKSILLTAGLFAIFLGLAPREAKACADGIARFGKVSCAVGDEELVRAYFYAATSLQEIERVYGERLAKIRASCAKKVTARKPAGVEGAEAQLRFEAVEACGGKRGYQEPCQRNEDCLENFCHPDRGTCSAVFTVPVPFGN